VGSVSHGQGTVPTMGDEVPLVDVVVLLGGGIGAGKSSIAALFADRGFEVVEADIVGHRVLATDPEVRSAVSNRWPSVVSDGVIDRAALAEVVFSDPSELRHLEQITHPRIRSAIVDRIAESQATKVVVEIPLTSMNVNVDGAIVRVAVVADHDVRLARAVIRGGDAADIQRRMRLQDDDATWRAWADHVVDNSGAWTLTERTIQTLIDGMASDA
jgi:dephospho-CoA kinase